MNELITIGSVNQKMSSREIAELMEKEHKNVLRDIKSLIEQGAINGLNFELVDYKDAKGEKRPEYLLDFDATMTLITGYDAKRRAMVVKRWRELETGAVSQPFRLPATFAEALRALADESEKTAALQKQIELDRPKTIFADAVTVSHTTILVGELAKLLKQNGFEIGQNRLFERLRRDGWLIKRHGSDWNMPTQKGMELGLFEIKERTINDANGAVRITKTVKVTGRGQVFFINMFIKERDGAVVPIQAVEQEVVGSPADIAPIN